MRCYSHQHIRQSTITKHAYNGDSYRPINQIARRNEDEYALVGIPKVSNWWPIQFWPYVPRSSSRLYKTKVCGSSAAYNLAGLRVFSIFE